MPLHHVREMLGDANISQTDTYLNADRFAAGPCSASTSHWQTRGKRATDEENRPVRPGGSRESSKDLRGRFQPHAPVAQLDRAPAF